MPNHWSYPCTSKATYIILSFKFFCIKLQFNCTMSFITPNSTDFARSAANQSVEGGRVRLNTPLTHILQCSFLLIYSYSTKDLRPETFVREYSFKLILCSTPCAWYELKASWFAMVKYINFKSFFSFFNLFSGNKYWTDRLILKAGTVAVCMRCVCVCVCGCIASQIFRFNECN